MVILRVDRLRKSYGEFCALDGVDFEVKEGEFLSIIGPNGAGKTTLINAISGVVRPDGGRVFFQDRDVTGLSPETLAGLGIVRSFQLIQIFPNLSVFDSLRVAVISRLKKGACFYTPLGKERGIIDQTLQVARLFKLDGKLNILAKHLSHGDKKLLDIASAFALHPEIILLDEPTSGVSTQEKHSIMEILVSASKEVGVKAVIQVEHDMDIVFSYSDRIIALHQGRVLADGTPEEVLASEEVVNTVLGKGVRIGSGRRRGKGDAEEGRDPLR